MGGCWFVLWGGAKIQGYVGRQYVVCRHQEHSTPSTSHPATPWLPPLGPPPPPPHPTPPTPTPTARCRNFGGEPESFQRLMNSVKRGDIVGVRGFPGKSKKGELSVFPTSMQVGGGGWVLGGCLRCLWACGLLVGCVALAAGTG